MNFNKFEVYGNPTLQQGGWVRTGDDNDYADYLPDGSTSYYYRICTLDYVPQHHPTQITITGIASKELEVSVLVLRSDNYIIASLGWQDNGYTFNLGSTYDKLGVMFRFKNGDAIAPHLVSFDIVGDWADIPHYIHNTSTDTITTLPAVLYPNYTTATVGLKGNMSQTGTPTPQNPIQPQECGDLETVGEKAGQYKIPISSASTTTPVYLGEVETTRKIKKLVLTGEEDWSIAGDAPGYKPYFRIKYITTAIASKVVCTHYTSPDANISVNNGVIGVKIQQSSEFGTLLIVRPPEFAIWSVDDFKAYLAAQYTNGTPVTVWYVLATEETGIVNEPIRKIGDYADTVSGITIPTIAGADSFDVLTTLKPSEVELTYTGWHDASVKEWDGSDWQ